MQAAAMPFQPSGHLMPSTVPGRRNVVRRRPIGVVGVITPWNFPLILAMRSVAPALAVGNAVVLKPDLKTPFAGGLMLAQLFADAGLPADVLQVLPGGPEAGEALVTHPATGMISFTGSSAVGRKVGAIAGGLLKKVALELGGNSAMIVLDDADLDLASSCGAWASYLHQGQICMAAGRHLVHRRVAADYIERLTRRANALHVGDPAREQVHLGPLISEKQRDRVHRIVTDTLAAGAQLTTGGSFDRLYYRPTVLTEVTADMPAFREEIFGPVAPVTTFEDDDEAVALANASDYGLSGSVHSRSIGRAMALADRLSTGMIHINDQTVNNEAHVPFGGIGASGNGSRFGGLANWEEFTVTQWVSQVDAPHAYPF
jgi:benzaldehyde dehydrogenase (NAD)